MLARSGGVDAARAANASSLPTAAEIHPPVWLPPAIPSRPATVAGNAMPASCAVEAAATPRAHREGFYAQIETAYSVGMIWPPLDNRR